jgi:hypothetical protein
MNVTWARRAYTPSPVAGPAAGFSFSRGRLILTRS